MSRWTVTAAVVTVLVVACATSPTGRRQLRLVSDSEMAQMGVTAFTDFDAALKINPRLTSSLYGRGLAKQRNGSISEGNLDIANAKAMDPNVVQEFESYGVH